MIEVKDRIPTYPGRVRMTPVAGQANTYDMVRADDPIEPGTPINRALFQAFIDEVNAIRQRVDDKLFEISQRVKVGNLNDGTVFGLNENGILVPFIKLKNNHAQTGRILVVRQSCITSDTLLNTNESNYENGRTDRWLNNEYLPMLDAATQSVISDVNLEVFTNQNYVYIPRKVFLLSADEYQVPRINDIGPVGDAIPYFSTSERRIATLNGTPVTHWTRNNNTTGQNAVYVTETGGYVVGAARTFVAGIRPAFTLSADYEVTVGVPSTENVMATAEVI